MQRFGKPYGTHRTTLRHPILNVAIPEGQKHKPSMYYRKCSKICTYNQTYQTFSRSKIPSLKQYHLTINILD